MASNHVKYNPDDVSFILTGGSQYNLLAYGGKIINITQSRYDLGTKTLEFTASAPASISSRETGSLERKGEVQNTFEISCLNDCYSMCVNNSEYKIKIDSDNVLNPKDLSPEDKILLKMLSPNIPDFVWTIYYLMKDCLDSKISEEELLDRLYEMKDNNLNFKMEIK